MERCGLATRRAGIGCIRLRFGSDGASASVSVSIWPFPQKHLLQRHMHLETCLEQDKSPIHGVEKSGLLPCGKRPCCGQAAIKMGRYFSAPLRQSPSAKGYQPSKESYRWRASQAIAGRDDEVEGRACRGTNVVSSRRLPFSHRRTACDIARCVMPLCSFGLTEN